MPIAPALLESVSERAANLRDRLIQGFSARESDRILPSIREFESLIDDGWSGKTYFHSPPEADAAWAKATAGFDARRANRWAAILLADLISLAPERLPKFPTPNSILPHTCFELSRILHDVERQPEAARDLANDVFLKDLGLCRLDVFPCVAQIVEKGSGIPRGVVAKSFAGAPRQLAALGWKSAFRFKPFFEIHTHTPMLAGFTPHGWDMCYVLIADLLELYPRYQGMVGSSWFYDPALDRVSPRLAYLRERPLDGGAFLVRFGQSESDIKNATATSESRRKMYESGEYLPTAFSLIWPRNGLLSWVARNREQILAASETPRER